MKDELYVFDDRTAKEKTKIQTSGKDEFSSGLRAGTKELGANPKTKSESSAKESVEFEEEYVKRKIDFLLQHILSYQSIFKDLTNLFGGEAYLFLDDLYHIRRGDPAKLLDYFHRIAKANRLWLKVGTIRHRSS